MKNKKLFAILTLVCFMFTLMPVAAFADATTLTAVQQNNGDVVYTFTLDAGEKLVYNQTGTGTDTEWAATSPATVGASNIKATWKLGGYVAVVNADGSYAKKLPFTAEQLRIAAQQGTNAADSLSAVEAQEADVAAGELAVFDLHIRNTSNALMDYATDNFFVWVTKDGSRVPVDTVAVYDYNNVTETKGSVLTDSNSDLIYELTGQTTEDGAFAVVFAAAGTYKVHVSANAPGVQNGYISEASEFNNANAVVNVYTTSSLTADKMQLTVDYTGLDNPVTLYDGDEAPKALVIAANNVDEEDVEVVFATKDGNPLQNMTLKVETAGAIDVSAKTVKTGVTGKAEFTVSGHAEGNYKIYVSFGQFEVVIPVQVGATGANEIEVTKEPSNPVDIIGATSFVDVIEFAMYDVNGNKLATTNKVGWEKAAVSAVGETGATLAYTDKYAGYVAVLEQPAKAKLENKDLYFNGKTIVSKKAINAEGTYTFKVVLDNGNYATASVEVKAFTKPVKLIAVYPGTVELGANTGLLKLYWLDANGVEKSALTRNTDGAIVDVKVDLAASGYAVDTFTATTGALEVESDEKYIGSEITITAVDDRYNLVATAKVKVADEAKDLAFTAKTAEVKVNNHIKINVVDSQGNVVVLGGENNKQGAPEISFVILDKPEGAKVFASNVASENKLLSQGYFTMNLVSDKVGVVEVQAVVRYEATDSTTGKDVVKYYTGTQEIAVGMDGNGDILVMSIGSNQYVINDEVKAMDAKAVIKNSRTFVPLRSGLEALGATVAYDDATQSVTAVMNGKTVVMTIGSAEYTVNGVAATMDVAPFIDAAANRTMVPASYAAKAFGMTVNYTTNDDGSVADVIFAN